jgi:hypothetical protein
MKTMTKRILKSGLIAAGIMTLAPMAASAGEWRLDARKCPDLREDRYDRMHNNGWRDRREDRRDERVINCPARAWYYVRSPGERRHHAYMPPRPYQVFVYRDGRHFYRDSRGAMIRLNLNLG